MPTLIIDDREISVQPGTTIMEAARLLGIQIPHFCYHPELSVAGNCRMCMVEVEKMPKPVISCAMPVNEGMVVRTDSEMVRKARRGVMEFLLINHPLDCPVCDQGGECKLQDYALKYGPDRSRFRDKKRTVHNHDLGPVIETEMNRCIHCTRCIRFSTEVAGVEEMGAIFRGDHMKVVPEWAVAAKERSLSSELAGNLAQLCPVGALNLKPFHFQARGWELTRSQGICPHCPVGCHTRVDTMNDRIYRVMGARCPSINMEWLCDKGRFAHEGRLEGRLVVPMQVGEAGGPLVEVTWSEALDRVAALIKGVSPDAVAGLAGTWGQGGEELFAFQDFLRHSVGTPHVDYRIHQRDFSADGVALTRADLLLGTPIEAMETADAIFLIGADPRYEMPLLNVRLRKASLNGATVWSVGPRHLESTLEHLEEVVVFPGEEGDFLRKVLLATTTRRGPRSAVGWAGALKKAQRPLFLLGRYAVNHPQAEVLRRLVVALLEKAEAMTDGWRGYNRMVTDGNAAAAEDLGVVPHRGPGYRAVERVGMNAREILERAGRGEIKVLFLMGIDGGDERIDARLAAAVLAGTRVIFMGAFDNRVARAADVVLPGLVHGERAGTLTNAEGRVAVNERVVMGPLTAKEDWRILRALSQRFDRVLPYGTLEELRAAMGRADGRYAPAAVGSSSVSKGCDHGVAVTRNLEFVAEVTAAEGDANRLALVLVPSFFQDTPLTRGAPTLAALERGVALRIGGKDARKYRVEAGGRVRVMCDGRGVEVAAMIDERMEGGILVGCPEKLRGLGEGTDGILHVTIHPL